MFDKDSVCQFDIKEYQSEERAGTYLLISSKYRNWLKTSKTGLEILRRLDGSNSLQDIANQIATIYDMPNKKILNDIIAFCDDLEKKGFLNGERKLPNLYKNYFIDVHNDCPFACIYCNKKCQFDSRFLEIDAFKSILEKYMERDHRSTPIINLTGGEPLMNPDIENIITYLGMEGYKFCIHTSGYKFNSSISEKIKKYEGTVYLSIDSSKEEINDSIRGKNSFSTAINAAKIMQKLEIPFYISCTPIKDYFQETIDLLGFAYNLGAVGIKINQPIKIDVNGEQINPYFDYTLEDFFELENRLFKQFSIINSWRNNNIKKQRKFVLIPTRFNCVNSIYMVRNKKDCGMAYNEVALDIDGNIYPCHMLQNIKFSNCHNSKLEVMKKNQDCIKCKYWIFCLGGCVALDYYFDNGHEQYCDYAKHFYDSLFWGE